MRKPCTGQTSQEGVYLGELHLHEHLQNSTGLCIQEPLRWKGCPYVETTIVTSCKLSLYLGAPAEASVAAAVGHSVAGQRGV